MSSRFVHPPVRRRTNARLLPVSALVLVMIVGLAPLAGAAGGPPALPYLSRFSSLQQAVSAGALEASVLRDLRSAGRVDAIVSFKFQEILAKAQEASSAASAAGLRPKEALAAHSTALLRVTAPAYRLQKQRAFAGVDGVTVIHGYDVLPTAAVTFRSEAALMKVLNDPDVEAVRADQVMQMALAESLPLIGQPTVFAQGHGGAGTAVAVLDTGVDYTLAAFGKCSAPGVDCMVAYAHDFAPNDGALDASSIYHGTNVAGIAVGVAPATRILALDVFTGDAAYNSDTINAINWTIANQATYGTRAINMSLAVSGTYHTRVCSSSFTGPFANARAVGILPVVASGNTAAWYGPYTNGVAMPTCTAGAVRVGAVYDSNVGAYSGSCTESSTIADKVTCFSQGGRLLSLLAPGSRITAAGYTLSGTSQAAPHVSGAVAVLAEAAPGATAAQIETALSSTGPLINDARSGLSHHRLFLPDALAALADASGTLSINDVSLNEGNSGTTNFMFTVSLLPASASTVTVNYATADGTAGAPDDYTVSAGTLTFSPGQTSRPVNVSVVGDTWVESDETFDVTLSGASGAEIFDASGIGTILNEDSSLAPVTVTGRLSGGYATLGAYRVYHRSSRVKYLGAVSPNHSGQLLFFEVDKYVGDTWVTLSQFNYILDSSSQVALSWDGNEIPKGYYSIICWFAGDAEHRAGQSQWRGFEVTK